MYIPIIAAVFIIVAAAYFIKTSNKIERFRVKIQEADSGIDVALVKRYDTLTKLYEITRGYMKHEQEIILQAIKLRRNMSLPDKAHAETLLDLAARQVHVVAEAYPALTSQTTFVQLQKAVMDTEEHLQAARRVYNSNISLLNQIVVSFPSSLVAGIKGVRTMPMFEAEAAKRSDVDLRFAGSGQ